MYFPTEFLTTFVMKLANYNPFRKLELESNFKSQIMNPQAQTIIPIPIIEEIISFSQLKEKLLFRQSCKLFLLFTNREFFPTITTTLCGSLQGYEDGEALKAKFGNYCS